MAAMLIKLTDF